MIGQTGQMPVSGWIDIHCHIIPAVDDGPRTMDESLEMIAMAAEAGTAIMVATPHRNSPMALVDDSGEILTRFKLLRNTVKAEGIPVKLLLGAEVYCRENLLERLSADRLGLTLAGSDYFLLEFPTDILIPGSNELIRCLVQQGLVPIIVHPERNEQVQQDPDQLLPFIESGAMIQLTGASIEGRLGGNALECAKAILKRNMAHIVASDCHDADSRTPCLDGLTKQKLLEPRRAEMLMNRLPAALVENLAPPDIGPIVDDEAGGVQGMIDWILRRWR